MLHTIRVLSLLPENKRSSNSRHDSMTLSRSLLPVLAKNRSSIEPVTRLELTPEYTTPCALLESFRLSADTDRATSQGSLCMAGARRQSTAEMCPFM
jgi:hypothetical protein